MDLINKLLDPCQLWSHPFTVSILRGLMLRHNPICDVSYFKFTGFPFLIFYIYAVLCWCYFVCCYSKFHSRANTCSKHRSEKKAGLPSLFFFSFPLRRGLGFSPEFLKHYLPYLSKRTIERWWWIRKGPDEKASSPSSS